MRHFTTPTQWRILKYFWRKQDVFTIDDLVKEGIIHFPALGRLTLWIMEERGQVLSRIAKSGDTLYIATTVSKQEWKQIWPSLFSEPFSITSVSCGVRERGINQFERAEVVKLLYEILEEVKQRENGEE